MDVRSHDFFAELGRLQLVVIAHGRKYAGNSNGFNPFFFKPKEKSPGCPGVKGSQLLAVVLKTASDHGSIHGNGLQILRPVHHRRNTKRSRCANAQDADRGKPFALRLLSIFKMVFTDC